VRECTVKAVEPLEVRECTVKAVEPLQVRKCSGNAVESLEVSGEVIVSLISSKKNNFEISVIYIRDPFGPLRALLIFVISKSVHLGGVPLSC